MKSQEKSSSTLTIPTNPTNNNQFVFSFTCDPEDILDIFEKVASDLSFDMIEREGSYATAVKKIQKKRNMLSLVNCFAWFQSDRFTAVKVILSRQSRKGALQDNYIAEIKGLVGVETDIEHFINTYERTILKLGLISSSAKIMLVQGDLPPVDPTQNQNPYYLQACTHHIINKLILNSQYELSDNISKMLSDFTNNFRNMQESVELLPLPMKNAVSIISDVNQQLEKLLAELKYPHQILPFSRIAVENYIFNKVEEQLYSIYRLKNIQTQKIFHQKRQKILETYTIKQILDQVCLNKKFWSINTGKIQQLLPMKEAKKQIFFNSASKQFEKIVFTNNPREKIKYCQMAYTQLKSHFYDFSKRKYSSMEDIIPVLIVIVLFLEVGGLRSEFDIMLDFINYDPNEMEAEKRLLINLSESYNYIHRDWNLK